MACPEFEDLILDYCDGAASPADSALLEVHVADCGDCRAYLTLQRELDLRISRSIPRPALSPEFAWLLAARIAEARHSPRVRWLPRMLDWTGYLCLAAAAGYLIQELPHSGNWVGLAALAGSAAFSLWETGKVLRDNFGR